MQIKSEFFKNVLTLMTGTVVAQLIPVIISPILTRLYTPDDFAIWALYMSIVMVIISGLSTGNFEFAIIFPKEDNKAIKLIELSILIALSVSIILLILSFIFNHGIGVILKNTAISSWLYFLPLSVFTLSILNSFIYWFNRGKDYKTMAINKIIKNAGISTINLGIGLSGIKKTGLILGQILGDIIAAFILCKKFCKSNQIFKKIDLKEYKKLVKEYKKFPLLTLPTQLLNNLSAQLPVMLISMWYSSSLTGYYFFSLKILSIPMAFIGTSVSQTFFQKFNEIKDNKTIHPKVFILKIWSILFLIGIIPLSLIFFFGVDIFSFVFGNEWSKAGQIASILTPMILVSFISSPTSTSFIILNEQKYSLIFGIVLLIIRPLAFYIGYINGDFFTGLRLLVVFEILEMFFYNIIVWKKLSLKD
jgi:O-antigen/teichoic acid export membrane protein